MKGLADDDDVATGNWVAMEGDGAAGEVKGVGIDAARVDAGGWDKFDAALDISSPFIDEIFDEIDLNGVGGESISCSSIVVVVVSGIIAAESAEKEAASSMPLSTTFGSSTFISSMTSTFWWFSTSVECSGESA